MSRRNSGYFVSHPVKIMADVSRNPREHWLKPLFSKNEVAKSGENRPLMISLGVVESTMLRIVI